MRLLWQIVQFFPMQGFLVLYTTTDGKKEGYTGNRGIEYRFKDKVRLLLHDQKSSDVQTNTTTLNRVTGLAMVLNRVSMIGRESVSKMGLAYFHPFTNRFNLGAILRNYSIEQSFDLNSRGILAFTGRGFPYFASTTSSAKMSGLVPGIGFEIKIFRWLEFSHSMERLNLKGTSMSTKPTIWTRWKWNCSYPYLKFG